ncbi:hypothetical protein [Mycolicibacterium arenosum]|uniref:PASTA domain-containing protein n=1 Tax=Mycolicibacterium arenosum TaxID=2952157 RepID=A0ABT1MBY6_9MYCO|nr:hypothetical protein [Mycolicibacterium sp. CAU 1645]MCP9275897.1 hypothetical protein [Mycolicibacterium sp. CAU 1645]
MMSARAVVLWTAAAATATAMAAAVPAHAASPPSVTGQTYSAASSKLSDAGFKPVVSTTVGDQKAWPDCLVSNATEQTMPPPPNSSGSPTNEVRVSLNCYSAEASATGAGYSAASPEGRVIAAEKAKEAADAKAAAAKKGS